MGVPKFFRWLSERYPAISQLIAENRIPEFDALYLDMNGIIHNCTHKDSDDTQFRLSEEEMFIRIFNYIEHLFGKIKPKQLFFMAVDGVAPRAKMNQQRARRFRTALDAEQAREKALREGQELPKEEPFDSNCITPGTEFMAKLSRQLRYFINKKVTEDKEWQGCEIVLSGHEVPGEGEHKIMEYIRNARAQPDYHPNMRHCLYGLDADLIMLGLLSHDPHFCLLREEVTFGRQSKVQSKELEHQNFYLMHLCIVREYLELEFQDLKESGATALSFPFDMEHVIDDFILMAFFVGNDFLPNLPRIHINEGALAMMFRTYKKVLPQCDGYINENGVMNLKRLGLLLEELSKEEYRFFEHEAEDQKWFRSKRVAENGKAAPKPKGKLNVTSAQKTLWKQNIKPFLTKRTSPTLDLGTSLNAADRKFVQDLADTANLNWSTDPDEEGERHLIISFPPKPEMDGDEEEEDESQLAINRLVKKYDNAEVQDLSADEAQAQYEVLYQQKFQEWKDKYYAEKFPEWTPETKEAELKKLCENYVQGLQWVLYYYYRGICSWPWFYQYHYAPLISDVIKGLGADLDFKLGQPFKPFEQLMGVLPDRSKKIVPTVYWDLMTNPSSPIIDFYPRDFELDMNGKKMDWEAVIKIPFIDEKRLLDAMAPKNEQLSDDEKGRNGFSVPIKFTYSAEYDFIYPSSMVGIFPDISHCHCVENIFELPPIEGLANRQGLMDGALLSVSALAGFPSLATLPYNATLGFHGVNVFQADSRNESMVVTLMDSAIRSKVESAKVKLGQRCFVGYPFLQEAKIVRVSDELFDYTLAEDGSGQVVLRDHSNKEIDDFNKNSKYWEDFYSKRLGILIGDVESMVHVEMLKGLIKTDEGATVKEYGEIPGMRDFYASQTVVDEVVNEDERFLEKAALPLQEEFPLGTRAFYLGDFNYGRPLAVTGYDGNKLDITVSKMNNKEPDFAKQIIFKHERENKYIPSFHVARDLNLHPLAFSKITSSYQVVGVGGLKVNLGLNLKFESRKMKVLGYSKKSDSGWEYSRKAIQLIAEYVQNFPDFFAGVQKHLHKRDIVATDIWADEKTATARVKEIAQYLKSVGTNNFPKVPLEAEQLDSNVVMELAQAAEAALAAASDTSPQHIKSVPRSALLKPSDAEQRLGGQSFRLGDRVVYIQDVGKVPIASRGTVVGISRAGSNKILDVLFDITFMSGNTLDGRCPAFRGQTVPATSVLNLTSREVVIGSKAQLARAPHPSLTTLVASGGYGAPGGSGKNYRDAPAPAPLTGSWRGALNGHRGGSHRGSLNIQPSNLVYRPSSNQTSQQGYQSGGRGGYQNGYRGGRGGNNGGAPRGRGGPANGNGGGVNGHSQAQGSYNAVPPPASLDARGGRGGGRGRGRGNRGRGRGGPAQQQPAA